MVIYSVHSKFNVSGEGYIANQYSIELENETTKNIVTFIAKDTIMGLKCNLFKAYNAHQYTAGTCKSFEVYTHSERYVFLQTNQAENSERFKENS